MVAPAGLVIRDLPLLTSNWRSSLPLRDYSSAVAWSPSPTSTHASSRECCAEKGAQAGCIMTGDNIDANAAVHAARRFPGLAGMDLAKVVSTREPYQWNDGVIWREPGRHTAASATAPACGGLRFRHQRNILRLLAEAGCRITVVPAQTLAAEVLALQPDGIFLSNGPGDPEPCTYAIDAIREFLKTISRCSASAWGISCLPCGRARTP